MNNSKKTHVIIIFLIWNLGKELRMWSVVQLLRRNNRFFVDVSHETETVNTDNINDNLCFVSGELADKSYQNDVSNIKIDNNFPCPRADILWQTINERNVSSRLKIFCVFIGASIVSKYRVECPHYRSLLNNIWADFYARFVVSNDFRHNIASVDRSLEYFFMQNCNRNM